MSRLPLLLPLLVACKQDVQITQLHPRIAVAPEALDFGPVASPVEVVEPLFLTNTGRAPLDFTVAIEGGGGAFTASTDVERLATDASLALQVRFRPPSFLAYDAELVITSNDVERPEVRVPLTGVGISAPLPDIDVDPRTVDFGEVGIGSTGTQFLLVRNTGDAPLTLGPVLQLGSGAFSLVTDPSGSVVGPFTDLPVILAYNPFSDQGDSGTIAFRSDDPDEPSVEVVLLGNGGGDYAYPVAEIACPGTSEPPIWVEFDGSASHDPEGHLPLTYAWTLLSRPIGSQESLTNAVSPTTRLFTDVAGPYEVQLQVTNAVGTVSAPARCLVDAIPADDLHVELSWDGPAADLDLHLAREGADLFAGRDDCNFCNTNPNWGVAGTDDDPRLDLDDQGGFGPENINLRTPAETDYEVRVHYFERHGDDVITARVRVWTYGALAWEGTRTMTRDQVWEVGRVNWPDGTFGAYSTVNTTASTRTCVF